MISVASDVYIFLELAISKDTMRFRHVRRVVSACVRYFLCVSWPWASGFWGQISDKIMAHQWIQTDDILWIGWRENLENLGIFTYYIFFGGLLRDYKVFDFPIICYNWIIMGWIMRFFWESLKRLSEKRILGTPPANLTGRIRINHHQSWSIWAKHRLKSRTATDLGQIEVSTIPKNCGSLEHWYTALYSDCFMTSRNKARSKNWLDKSIESQNLLWPKWAGLFRQPQIELLNPWLIGLGVMKCYEATVFALGMFSWFGKLHP
jgi:hypothetical protein